MSRIHLKTSYIQSTSASLPQLKQKLGNIENGVSSLRYSIDRKILNRSSVGSSLSRVKQEIDQLQSKIGTLQRFINKSVADYSHSESYLNKKVREITPIHATKAQGGSTNNSKHGKTKDAEKWKNKDAKVKDSSMGITGFDWTAPIAGSNVYGTMINAGVTGHVMYRAANGYEVIRGKDMSFKVTEDGKPLQRKTKPKGRPRAKYKIYDGNYVKKQIADGNYIKGSELVSVKAAAVSAAKDKLGWASIGIDVVLDTKENISDGASGSKITGDVLGNVAVGVGTGVAATALTIAMLPAAAPVAAIAAVGFGLSVLFSYAAEGVKWNVDLDKDGEDDSIKDMVKTGFSKACSTVAGWFKWKK